MENQTENYSTHYTNLKKISETIRNQSEPDIDALVPMVDSAITSMKYCKDRLAAVKAILGEKLPTEMQG